MTATAVPGETRRLLVSMPEARAMLGGIGRDAMYALDAKGRIRSTKVEGRRLYFVDSLEAYVRELAEDGPIR